MPSDLTGDEIGAPARAWRDFLHQLERERFECLTPEQMEARRRLTRIPPDTDDQTAARREALKGDS